MAMKPLSSWISGYESGLQDHYDAVAGGSSEQIQDFWQGFVDDNAQGLGISPPYQSTASTSKAAFAPVVFSPTGLPPVAALVLASAWQKWYLACSFPPPPPAPPFLTIISVVPSPLGVVASYAALLAGLTAEMVIAPPEPGSMKIKAIGMATLFHVATLTAGVQITGTAPGAPPPPLVLPLIPVL